MRTGVHAAVDVLPARPDGVAVLNKALDILEALVAAGESVGLTELSRAAGINKATAHRILTTLEARGFLAREPDSRRYVPGSRLVAMATAVTAGTDLVQAALPVLESLRKEFGETVNLGVVVNDAVEYLYIIEADHGLRMAARPGAKDWVHSTALGKAVLARMDLGDIDELLARIDLHRLTPNTITDRILLRKELSQIQSRGYAIDEEENELGARCIAAPIVDASGTSVAALSISGPMARVTEELVPVIGQRLVTSAAALGGQLIHVRPERAGRRGRR
jgi:IclR family acetate operon transcriptional repressor